ncbi:hypothetical protein CDAR_291261 [Caerostris darwini]|uniref:Uncharacterized protein n=1 Tax=Caerostris darwini TaxID=1538125 RepID=A0AAV4RL34_9ARAC|nr:hypothetical protein CDAR_291261 [Caerostris darwini]
MKKKIETVLSREIDVQSLSRSNSRNGGHHRWALEEILPKSQGQAVVVPLANHNILAPAAIKLDVTYWIRMRDVIALQSEGGGAMMSSPTNGSVLEESNTLRWHSDALLLLPKSPTLNAQRIQQIAFDS